MQIFGAIFADWEETRMAKTNTELFKKFSRLRVRLPTMNGVPDCAVQ